MPDHHTPHSSFKIIRGACDLFLSAFTSLHRPYTLYPFIAHNRHVETIFVSLLHSPLMPGLNMSASLLANKDDNVVALDWVSGDHQSAMGLWAFWMG